MKADTKDIEVTGGVRLTTTKLPPVRALVLSKKLVPIVAPLLAGVVRLENIDVARFSSGYVQLSDTEQVRLMLEVFASTSTVINGEIEDLTSEATINAAFPDVFSLYDAMWKVIAFNFFPTGAGEFLVAALKKAIPNP